MTNVVTHAADRRGLTNCGDSTPGRRQANVEKYPENWSQVTCESCTAAR